VLEGLRRSAHDPGDERLLDPSGVGRMQDGFELGGLADLCGGVAGDGQYFLGPGDLVLVRLIGPGADAGGLGEHPAGALGLGQLGLALALMSGVANDADQLAVLGKLGAAFEPAPAAVLHPHTRNVVAEAVGPQPRHMGVDVGVLVRMQEVARELADDFGLAPAGLPLESGIDQLEALVSADDEHHLAAVLEQPLDRRRSLRRPRRGHRPFPQISRET
jgi:hypothetical protein